MDRSTHHICPQIRRMVMEQCLICVYSTIERLVIIDAIKAISNCMHLDGTNEIAKSAKLSHSLVSQ